MAAGKLFLAIYFLVFLSPATLLASHGTCVSPPTIIRKSEWGSMKEGEFWNDRPYDPYSQGVMEEPIAITIHHTAIPLGTNPPDPEQDRKKVLDIQHFHVGKGWGDIGYHFLIGSDGQIYEGRPLGYTGTHAPPNYGNIGVNIIGDFHTQEYPSNLQLDALVQLISWLCDQFDIDPTARITIFGQSNLAVCGHRDWGPTACPGDRLYALIPALREQIRARLLSGPPYDSRISARQFLPRTLLAGCQYDLTFTVRNTGFVPWSWLNEVKLEALSHEIATVAEPALKDQETITPLSNRTWEIHLTAPGEPGTARVALGMSESGRRFGPELAWDVSLLAPENFISTWLTAGPFDADTPEKAYAKDFFLGEPLDELDVMDPASESAHDYQVTGEYANGEENNRGEDGERSRDSGRYYRGTESFRMSLQRYKGGDLVIRKTVNASYRDQKAEVCVGGRRLSIWEMRGQEIFRRWKQIDLLIPAYRVSRKKSVDVTLKVLGTKQWGCNSFRYVLLDKCEPLTAPKPGDKGWKPWISNSGVTDLSSVFPGTERGAVYLAVYVKSPYTKWVQLRTGFPGRLKAWFNGNQILSSLGGKPSFPDTEQADVLIKEGWNRLLVKVILEPAMRQLYVRLCDKDGAPLTGLTYRIEPSDKSTCTWVAANH